MSTETLNRTSVVTEAYPQRRLAEKKDLSPNKVNIDVLKKRVFEEKKRERSPEKTNFAFERFKEQYLLMKEIERKDRQRKEEMEKQDKPEETREESLRMIRVNPKDRETETMNGRNRFIPKDKFKKIAISFGGEKEAEGEDTRRNDNSSSSSSSRLENSNSN